MSPLIETSTPASGHGWTPERKALFLERLSVHGNARAACRNVGLSPESAYKLRRRDPLFARAWSAAVVLGRENSIQALAERAIEGVEEQIYYRGELVGTRRRYDSRLLLAHLARLDKLADEDAAGADAGRFDELVACVADGVDDVIELTREQNIEQVAKYAQDRMRREEKDAYYEGQGADDGGAQDDDSWDDPFDEDFEVELESRCREHAERVREAAAEGWENRQKALFATVDALIDPPRTPVAAGLPACPSPPSIDRIRRAASQFADRPEAPRFSFPCTLSTASTAALATALAGPPGGRNARWRSPFSAPRRTGAPG